MKINILIALSIALFSCGGMKQTAPVSLSWEAGRVNEKDISDDVFTLKNDGRADLESNWTIYLTWHHDHEVSSIEGEPAGIERIQAGYLKVYPTEEYKTVPSGETMRFAVRRGALLNYSDVPVSAYIVFTGANGKESPPASISLEIKPYLRENQSKFRNDESPYPDGEYMYAQNAIFDVPVVLDDAAIFPSVKQKEKLGGVSVFSKNVCLKYDSSCENEAALLKEKLIALGCKVSGEGETQITLKLSGTKDSKSPEGYELTIRNNQIAIAGNTPHGVFNAAMTLLNMIGSAGELPKQLSDLHITDEPDLPCRGIMLDAARSFIPKKNLLETIDLLSSYKINVIHLHLADDEGWRIEIPELPELIAVGSHRGHTHDESDCLYPIYAGGWNAGDATSTANGYYSRKDFIEILKYAQQRHIQVIPEVDIPGHSRAAVKSMNARYRKYIAADKAKAEEYLLTDFADNSKYSSAQGFTDNTMNIALPSAYHFVATVVDAIRKMYSEAGIVQEFFNIGGDEVPEGSWSGSPAVHQFMQENNLKNTHELSVYFLKKIFKMLSERNLRPAGWAEITETPVEGSHPLAYCWGDSNEKNPLRLAGAGEEFIVCNNDKCYLDMAYNKHKDEAGTSWAGLTDEYETFAFFPCTVYQIPEPLRGALKGMQACVWGETINRFDMVQLYLFPKVFGLVERAWNMTPAYEGNSAAYNLALREYNARIAEKELPRLAKQGVNFHVSQPGITVRDGLLYANSAIPQAVIRYTTDGSEPAEQSPVWTKPVAFDAFTVKAKAYYLGKESVASELKIKN